jgi:hypothetical protein
MQTRHDPMPCGMCYWEILTVIFALLFYPASCPTTALILLAAFIQYVLPTAFLLRALLRAMAYQKRCSSFIFPKTRTRDRKLKYL